MDTLTGGVFLAGLGLFLGANSFTIGLLASLPFLAQVIQFPTVKLLLHVRDRRKVVVTAAALSRTLLVVLGVVLLLEAERLDATRLLIVMGLVGLAVVVASAGWNWWMRDLIPREELGRFFARRMQLTTIASAAALLVAGWGLDRYVDRGLTPQGYGILFVLGGLTGLVGVIFLARTPHPEPTVASTRRRAIELVTTVLRHPQHRPLVLSLTFLAGTLTIALPFTAVFMLRTLGYSFLAITVLTLVGQLAYIESLRGWGCLLYTSPSPRD